MKIGILALQGDFEAHARMLDRLGAEGCFVRRPEELREINALILPGGESTTLLKFFEQGDFLEAVRRLPAEGKPVFGTCAGAILLAKELTGIHQMSLGLVDVTIERNGYGRQIASTVREGRCVLKEGQLEMVFIRAPRIRRVGPAVEVLGECEGEPVLVQQGNCLLATFHPELTEDTSIHEYFMKLTSVREAEKVR